MKKFEKRGYGLLNKELERVTYKVIQDNQEEYEHYSKHASLRLIKKILLELVTAEFYPACDMFDKGAILDNFNASNNAYSAGATLFEIYLEHGCNVISNGHHRAQTFAARFEKEFKYDRTKELIIK